MKLYSKKDFLKLPEGTVYFEVPDSPSKNQCLWVGSLRIKGESLGENDFYNSELNSSWFKNCDSSDQNVVAWMRVFDGEEVDLDFESYTRDGMYEDSDQYYVLNKNEVSDLIRVLTEAYDMAYKH